MARSKSHGLLSLLALLSISASFPAQAARSDFFYLSLVWPGAFCNINSCCTPLTGQPAFDFFVESMETYDSYTGNMVTNCNSTCSFYVNQLRPFITDMFAYWADVSCPSNNGREMWESTFCKYGPCSNLNQSQYFQQALQRRAQLDLLTFLGTKGIVPSNKITYDLEDIESALRAKLSFSFVIECNGKTWKPWSTQNQLYKIKICVSSDGQKIISCPISKISNCVDQVKFVPFTSGMLHDTAANGDFNDNPIEMPTARDVVV